MWKFSKFAIIVLLFALSSACGVEDTAEENYTTELVIPVPESPGDTIEIGKRVRFSADPDSATQIVIESAGLSLLSPSGEDFAFIEALEVYLLDIEENRVLIAETGPYQPGRGNIALDVVFPDDVKPFVQDGNRIRIRFVARTSRWHPNWPSEGYSIQASVILRFDLI